MKLGNIMFSLTRNIFFAVSNKRKQPLDFNFFKFLNDTVNNVFVILLDVDNYNEKKN